MNHKFFPEENRIEHSLGCPKETFTKFLFTLLKWEEPNCIVFKLPG